MAGPQKARSQKSRLKGGKQIVKRELIKQIPTSNLETLIAETPKGTSFKGELRRKCLIELDRRNKSIKNLIVEQSKAGHTKTKTTNKEDS
tara:strand:- start:718 stop:987 length:270 start_codon:yes stop_codon:yes gene_type:complete